MPDNNGCSPDKYTSSLTYDGLKFKDSELAHLKPNCVSLNKVLESFAEKMSKPQSVELPYETKIIEIGPWDMTASHQSQPSHGLTQAEFDNVISFSVMIMNDNSDFKTDLGIGAINSVTPDGVRPSGIALCTSSGFHLERYDNYNFDSAPYSDAIMNRGFCVVNFLKP